MCPDGYRWEQSEDVTGIRRKSEWVADDLLAKLEQLEIGLSDKLKQIGDDFQSWHHSSCREAAGPLICGGSSGGRPPLVSALLHNEL